MNEEEYIEIIEEEVEPTSITKAARQNSNALVHNEDITEKRERLLATYKARHKKKGEKPLIEQLSNGDINTNEAIDLIILELLKECEELKGNELLFMDAGNTRDAATIQIKRIEALDRVAKTIAKKHQMINEEVINLDSPFIRILVTYFIGKARDSLSSLDYDQNEINVFLDKLQMSTADWKREVKREILSFQEGHDDNEKD